MAKPIPLTLPPRDPKHELLARLEHAPAEHAAALLDGYELLQQLHDHGVFTLIRGALTASDKIVGSAAEGANSPESIRAIRNAILLGKLLGSIDPAVTQALVDATAETFGTAKSFREKPPGTFSLVASFAQKEPRRVLALIVKFLHKLGSSQRT